MKTTFKSKSFVLGHKNTAGRGGGFYSNSGGMGSRGSGLRGMY